jgi:hypothetical protein
LRQWADKSLETTGVAAMAEDFSMKEVLSLCIDWSSPTTSRSTLNQFVREVDGGRVSDDERRTDRRKPVVLDIIAVPLGENRQPCGEPFLALSRNISRGGIALLHTENVRAPYLLLRIETTRHQVIQTVVEVVRSRRFYQFTEISGRFKVVSKKKRSSPRVAKPKSHAVAR